MIDSLGIRRTSTRYARAAKTRPMKRQLSDISVVNDQPAGWFPFEIWLVIFEFAAGKKALLYSVPECKKLEALFQVWSCVCRAWSAVVNEFVPLYFDPKYYRSNWLLKQLQGSLTKLHLFGNGINDDCLSRLTNLTFLSISNERLTDSSLKQLTNLTSLRIHRVNDITHQSLSLLTNLKKLNLDYIHWERQKSFQYLPSLTDLEVSNMSSYCLSSLASLTNLTRLSIASVEKVNLNGEYTSLMTSASVSPLSLK